MIPDYPEPPPFVVPLDREGITLEPPQLGGECAPHHNDREYLDYRNTGGGYVPPTHHWTSNPKSDQDDLGSK
jgi:hypothetical protein